MGEGKNIRTFKNIGNQTNVLGNGMKRGFGDQMRVGDRLVGGEMKGLLSVKNME